MKRASFYSVLLATVFASSAGAASINLTDGVGYGLLGVSYESPVSPNASVEGGLGLARGAVTLVGGTKIFANPNHAGLFFGGRGVLALGSGAVGSGAIATGGYRFVGGNFQFDLEAGLGLVSATNGYVTAFGIGPAIGLSAGYRF